MIDTFRMGAYWGSRLETLNDVISKTFKMLNELSEADEQFINWYEGANSRKKALEKNVNINAETIERLYRYGIKDGELDMKGYPLHRLGLGLWSGHSDHESSSISIYAGGNFETENIKNCCIISFPVKGIAHDRLMRLEKVKSIMKIIIENWDPDTIVLNSKRLSDTFDTINEIGWVSYKKEITSLPKLNENIIYEPFYNGHLFYLNTKKIPDYEMMGELKILKNIDKQA